MRTRQNVIYFSPSDRPVPDLISAWMNGKGYPVLHVRDRSVAETTALRMPPMLIVVDADAAGAEGQALCRCLKGDPYTAIVPVAFLSGQHAASRVRDWFAAGADEVITPIFEPAEQRSRLDVLLLRTERNVAVNPSTRLPGTTDGDRVIFILSRILRDVVKGMCPTDGFIGHIGGDDFIVVLPVVRVSEVCSEIINVFDNLIPLQYNAQDRRAGYFFGKDRRGQLHRVPLMTLSIGIVTNEHRIFTHPAQVSELATEMKSYAKTLPGSVFVVDRRRGAVEA